MFGTRGHVQQELSKGDGAAGEETEQSLGEGLLHSDTVSQDNCGWTTVRRMLWDLCTWCEDVLL